MSKTTKIEFYIISGYRKVDKLKRLASEIENQYYQMKAETGQTLNYECAKRPWESRMRITLEGYQETVRDFLQRIRLSVDSLGLKGDPEHYYNLAA